MDRRTKHKENINEKKKFHTLKKIKARGPKESGSRKQKLKDVLSSFFSFELKIKTKRIKQNIANQYFFLAICDDHISAIDILSAINDVDESNVEWKSFHSMIHSKCIHHLIIISIDNACVWLWSIQCRHFVYNFNNNDKTKKCIMAIMNFFFENGWQ